MKLTGELKFFIGIIVASIAILAFAVVFLNRPSPTFSSGELLPNDTFTKGNKNATVQLVEFSDFQCPACKAYQSIVDPLVEQYKEKLVFGYRHFPLSQHKLAQYAAQAAEAAGEQGKFWEMSGYIFNHQDTLTKELINEGAQTLGLDATAFKNTLNSEKYKQKILRDLADGKRFGVNSTPTFFLNGKKLNLNSYNDLKKAVEQAITISPT